MIITQSSNAWKRGYSVQPDRIYTLMIGVDGTLYQWNGSSNKWVLHEVQL